VAIALSGHKAVVLHAENDRLAPAQCVSGYLIRIDVGKRRFPMARFVVNRYRDSTVVAGGRLDLVVFDCIELAT
jgi:hypothetical protein